MSQVFLSDTELYFSDKIDTKAGVILIVDDEALHILRVMRHKTGDVLHVTDGRGNIYKSEITQAGKKNLSLKIMETYSYERKFDNVTLCFPRLKITDRFEFAIEKCVELGFTKFAIIKTERTLTKGEKLERWNKVALAAMKQSLNAHMPEIRFYDKPELLIEGSKAKRIVLSQSAENKLIDINDAELKEPVMLFFGPEGGLTGKDLEMIKPDAEFRLTGSRLRGETAVISAASIVASKF